MAQIDETLDLNEIWSPDAVDFCSWTFKDGKANVFRTHWFQNEPLAEKKNIEIPYGTFFRFKIESVPGGFDCYLNGELFQSARFQPFPIIAVTATEDEELLIIKITNSNNSDAHVQLEIDHEVDDQYELITLGNESEHATNSLDDPCRVVPKNRICTGAGMCFGLNLKSNSLK